MTKPKYRAFGANFLGYAKSASLRGQNADVEPEHFVWTTNPAEGEGYFFFDAAIASMGAIACYGDAVAVLLEPRCLRPENYEYARELHGNFKYILSYDKEFLEEIPNGLYYPFGGSSIAFDKWGIYPKTKNVAMFYSGKDTTEGHKLRKQIVEQFGDRIDVYGAGVGKPVDTKFEVLKDYRYCVVVESCFINGYWSEKLIDCFATGTWPLYCGGMYFLDLCQTKFHISGYKVKDAYTGEIRLPEHFFWSNEKSQRDWYYEVLGEGLVHHNLKLAKQYRCVEDWLWLNLPEIFE